MAVQEWQSLAHARWGVVVPSEVHLRKGIDPQLLVSCDVIAWPGGGRFFIGDGKFKGALTSVAWLATAYHWQEAQIFFHTGSLANDERCYGCKQQLVCLMSREAEGVARICARKVPGVKFSVQALSDGEVSETVVSNCKRCRVFCSDSRIQAHVRSSLTSPAHELVLPGGPRVFNDPATRQEGLNALRFLAFFGGLKEVELVAHTDCGAYTEELRGADDWEQREYMNRELVRARQIIDLEFADLELSFRCFVLGRDSWYEVVTLESVEEECRRSFVES